MADALDAYDDGLKIIERHVKSASNPVSDSQMVTINQLCDGMKATYGMLHDFYIEMNSKQQNRFLGLVQRHENILKDYASKRPRIAPATVS